MAGGNNNGEIFNSGKPAKGTTEKKKRKRPSKKVPTTVLEASSNNFMNLVQKLTGSADELNYHGLAPAKSTTPSPYPSPYSSPSNQHEEPQHSAYHHHHHQYLPNITTSNIDHDDSGSSHNYNYNQAPYSSGSAYAGMGSSAGHPMDHHRYQSSYGYYGGGSTYVGSGSGQSRVTGGDHVDQDDDLYNQQQGYGAHSRYNSNESYPANSRAMDHQDDMSPFSWRDPMNHNSTSDYWYHVDPLMPAMRAS